MPPAFWSRLWPRKRRPTRSSPALPRARSTSEPCVSRAAQELHNAGANQVAQAAARAPAQPIAARQQARAEIRSLRSHSDAATQVSLAAGRQERSTHTSSRAINECIRSTRKFPHPQLTATTKVQLEPTPEPTYSANRCPE